MSAASKQHHTEPPKECRVPGFTIQYLCRSLSQYIHDGNNVGRSHALQAPRKNIKSSPPLSSSPRTTYSCLTDLDSSDLSITKPHPFAARFTMQQQTFPLQQEPIQQTSFSNEIPAQYQQQPPPLQEFYQPAATTSHPNDLYNQQQQPVYAPAELATVTPNPQNHTSTMQQPAFANSPRQRSQNRVPPAPLSQQGEYHVWLLQSVEM